MTDRRFALLAALVMMALPHAANAQSSPEQQRFFSIVKMQADRDDAQALKILGVMHQVGFAVAPNDAEAFATYSQAAEQNDKDACLALALMYDKGLGVAQDETEAGRWYQRAAGVGQPAQSLENSQGQFMSEEELIASAESGYVPAQIELAHRYENGIGFPRNPPEAMSWYRKAAEQGSVAAMLNLGRLLTEGRFVPPDKAEAMKWFRMAGEQADAARRQALRFMFAEYSAAAGAP